MGCNRRQANATVRMAGKLVPSSPHSEQAASPCGLAVSRAAQLNLPRTRQASNWTPDLIPLVEGCGEDEGWNFINTIATTVRSALPTCAGSFARMGIADEYTRQRANIFLRTMKEIREAMIGIGTMIFGIPYENVEE